MGPVKCGYGRKLGKVTVRCETREMSGQETCKSVADAHEQLPGIDISDPMPRRAIRQSERTPHCAEEEEKYGCLLCSGGVGRSVMAV